MTLTDASGRRRISPRVLEEIEVQRQRCRQYAEAAAAQRAQELRDQVFDDSRGYKRVSLETFVLDAKTMAANQSKVSVKGVYLPDGNVDWLLATQLDVIRANHDPAAARNLSKIPLLTEGANREFRQYLLRCKSRPGAAQTGCPTVITGHVTMCTASGALGANLEMPCIAVENGRPLQ